MLLVLMLFSSGLVSGWVNVLHQNMPLVGKRLEKCLAYDKVGDHRGCTHLPSFVLGKAKRCLPLLAPHPSSSRPFNESNNMG